MNIPGFTAEASLYKTEGNYRMIGLQDRGNGNIHPAYAPWAVPFRPGLPPRIAGYLYAVVCCRDCASECKSKCFDQTCIDACLVNCNSRCDAYGYGGCKQLLGL